MIREGGWVDILRQGYERCLEIRKHTVGDCKLLK